jgi:hypothetical protein
MNLLGLLSKLRLRFRALNLGLGIIDCGLLDIQPIRDWVSGDQYHRVEKDTHQNAVAQELEETGKA